MNVQFPGAADRRPDFLPIPISPRLRSHSYFPPPFVPIPIPISPRPCSHSYFPPPSFPRDAVSGWGRRDGLTEVERVGIEVAPAQDIFQCK